MKKVIALAVAGAFAFSSAAFAGGVGNDAAHACVDTELSDYVNNVGTCEGTPGSWASVRIGNTCVNTYADDFRC